VNIQLHDPAALPTAGRHTFQRSWMVPGAVLPAISRIELRYFSSYQTLNEQKTKIMLGFKGVQVWWVYLLPLTAGDRTRSFSTDNTSTKPDRAQFCASATFKIAFPHSN